MAAFNRATAITSTAAIGKVNQTFFDMGTCLMCGQNRPFSQFVVVCQLKQEGARTTNDSKVPPCMTCHTCAINDKHVGARADDAGNKKCKVCPLTLARFADRAEKEGKPLPRVLAKRDHVCVARFQQVACVQEVELLHATWQEAKDCVTADLQEKDRQIKKMAHLVETAEKNASGREAGSAAERLERRQEIEEAAAEEEPAADAEFQAHIDQPEPEEQAVEEAAADSSVTAEDLFGEDDAAADEAGSMVGDAPVEFVRSSVAAAGTYSDAVDVESFAVARPSGKKGRKAANSAPSEKPASAKALGKRRAPPEEEEEEEEAVYKPPRGKKAEFQKWLKDKKVSEDPESREYKTAVADFVTKLEVDKAKKVAEDKETKLVIKDKIKSLPKLETELQALREQADKEREAKAKAEEKARKEVKKAKKEVTDLETVLSRLVAACNDSGMSSELLDGILALRAEPDTEGDDFAYGDDDGLGLDAW